MAALVSEEELKAVQNLLWSTDVGAADKKRWHEEGFQFSSQKETSFGLVQQHGGPCGVLAPIQAEILCHLLFEQGNGDGLSKPYSESQLESEDEEVNLPLLSQSSQMTVLAHALASTLHRAAGHHHVVVVQLTNDDPDFSIDSATSGDFAQTPSSSLDETVALLTSLLPQIQSRHGVLIFLISLILSRGIDQIREDMDDSSGRLIGQFGHCSQELLNLFICGRAVSNVFDGTVPMGDSGLLLKGIPHRCHFGYVSYLEALRYCQVGSNLKSPRYPVWVLGSTSHFTVLFGLDSGISRESYAETVLRNFQRAFREVDAQENGFVPTDQIPEVLNRAKVSASLLTDESQMAQLVSNLDPGETGIVVWDDFWRKTSVVVASQETRNRSSAAPTRDDISDSGRPRSDSDIARELQAQFDGENSSTASTQERQTNRAAPREQTRTLQRSDSDVARELQAQFDSETDATSSTGPNAGSLQSSNAEATPAQPQSLQSTSSAPPSERISARAAETSEEGEKESQSTSVASVKLRYILYHYNGLERATAGRGVALTKFVLTRPQRRLVGESVPLTAGGGGSGGQGYPIEDVLRTRWDHAEVDWLGQRPPSID